MQVPAAFSSGTLGSSGTLATGVGQGLPPFTIQLNSSSSGRAMSVSADGVNFFPLTPTGSVVSSALVTFNGPVSQFLFAGASGDTYRIL